MIAVAITGSFCSGKTFLLNYLAKLGYKTFSSDLFVEEFYLKEPVKKEITKILSLEYFDKAKIAKIIYDDARLRRKLENFVHPAVLKAIKDFKKKNSEEEFIFAEVPLLFETRFDKYFNYIVATICGDRIRLNRALKKGISLEIYRKIDLAQLPQEEKAKSSNFIFDNAEDLGDIGTRTEELTSRLRIYAQGNNTRHGDDGTGSLPRP